MTSEQRQTLEQIRRDLDRRLQERAADQARLDELKRQNAVAIRRAEQAKEILERA